MAVGTVPVEPRVFASYGQGWTNMWPVFWILLVFALFEFLVQVPGQVGQLFPEDQWRIALVWSAIGLALAFFVGGPLGMGVVKGHLKASRGDKPELEDLGYGFSRYWAAVLLSVLAFFIVAIGFILLILPGIYLAVRLTFVAHRFVNDGLEPMDAIKASFEDTRGRWWRTFALGLLAIPLFIAGLVLLGVGALVAAVWIEQAVTVYWRSIEQA